MRPGAGCDEVKGPVPFRGPALRLTSTPDDHLPFHERVDIAMVSKCPRKLEEVRIVRSRLQRPRVESAVVGRHGVVHWILIAPCDFGSGLDGDPARVIAVIVDPNMNACRNRCSKPSDGSRQDKSGRCARSEHK